MGSGGLNIPMLNLDLHVYSEAPAGRFVVINAQKYKEGGKLTEGPTVESITKDGVILVESGPALHAVPEMKQRLPLRVAYLDGRRFQRLLLGGIARLVGERGHLDRINVYPVPDGDTGTNLALTFTAVGERLTATSTRHAGELLGAAADAALDGARGNSGAIFAQYLQGLSEFLAGHERVRPEELALALASAEGFARSAIQNPAEGTVLTVMRDIAAAVAPGQLPENSDFLTLLTIAARQGPGSRRNDAQHAGVDARRRGGGCGRQGPAGPARRHGRRTPAGTGPRDAHRGGRRSLGPQPGRLTVTWARRSTASAPSAWSPARRWTGMACARSWPASGAAWSLLVAPPRPAYTCTSTIRPRRSRSRAATARCQRRRLTTCCARSAR